MRPRTLIPWLLCGLLVGCTPPSKLTLCAKQVKDRIEISGETSLPDGAQLLVGLRKEEALPPLCQALPLVKGHEYRGILKLPRGVFRGSYSLRLEFSPKAFAWSKEVIPAVGKNGEKLAGPLVRDSGEGYRILEVLAPIQLR